MTNTSITASYENNPACRRNDDDKRNDASTFISEAKVIMWMMSQRSIFAQYEEEKKLF